MKYSLILICIWFLMLGQTAFSQEDRSEGVSVVLPEHVSKEQVVQWATQVRPSYRQIDYQQREMLGFIHIGMNTFTGREWGTGEESPSLFNPTELDAEEWVKTFKAAGITGVILVAKHHDGFCTWPSKYTTHTVANSPWRGGKGDLVKEVADACRKHDMKLCLYLSPWDMHEKTYGTVAYNDFYIHQLEELLTQYGPVYLLWFDGAGTQEEVSGKNMPFQWERIFKRARELQPDVLLSGNAPDVRWVGNEKGKGRSTEWSVQGVNEDTDLFGSLKDYRPTLPHLGSVEDLMTKKRLVWYPSRGGLPLRKGWFYNAADDHTTKSLHYLVDSYFSTIGQNSNLLPNLSPDPSGRFPKQDADRLIAFGRIIQEMTRVDYAKGAKAIPESSWEVCEPEVLTDDSPFTSWHTVDGVTQATATLLLKQVSTFNVVKLQENIRDFGQRVERFAVDALMEGKWVEIATGTTIGFRRMLRLATPVTTQKLRIRVLDARVSVSLGNVSCFYLKDLPQEEVVSAEASRMITAKQVKTHLKIQGMKGKDVKKLTDANDKTLWRGRIRKNFATFVFELDKTSLYNELLYVPGNLPKGHIENYAVYVSEDGKTWNEPIAKGRLGNIENNPVEQRITFPTTDKRYVKLDILKTVAESRELEIADLMLVYDLK